MTPRVTFAEIAQALGIHKSNAERRAKRESWPSEKRPGRGGGVWFEPARLPKDVRAALHIAEKKAAARARQSAIAQRLPAVRDGAPGAAPAPEAEARGEVVVATPGELHIRGLVRRALDAAALTDVDRSRLEGALVLCHAMEGAMGLTACSARRASQELAARIVAGEANPELIDAAQVTYVKPRASGQTESSLAARLQKMHSAYLAGVKEGDAARYLVPGKRERDEIPPLHLQAFLLHFRHPSRPSVAQAWRHSAAWYAERGASAPAVDTFYRIERQLPVPIKCKGRMTGGEWVALLPYVSRDVTMFHANDIWVGDGHSLKGKVQHPRHFRPFVPEVTVILDWVSRLIVGWSVDLAESTIAVSAAFRHAQMQTRARPLVYYSDNGSGQTGKFIDHPVTGTLARQSIAHHTGRPGNPQGRGIIERLWRSTTIPLAQRYATCTWRGADKATVRGMLQSLNRVTGGARQQVPTFQQFLDDLEAVLGWDGEYNTQHRHKALGGITPREAYEARLDPGSIMTNVQDHELAALWLPEETRVPQRGVVQMHGKEYANGDLVQLLAEGEKVRVRFDIHDASRVWLLRMDGRFLCEAALDGSKKPAFDMSYMEQKREERAAGKIKRGERIIEEAREELGQVIESELVSARDILGPLDVQKREELRPWQEVYQEPAKCAEEPEKPEKPAKEDKLASIRTDNMDDTKMFFYLAKRNDIAEAERKKKEGGCPTVGADGQPICDEV